MYNNSVNHAKRFFSMPEDTEDNEKYQMPPGYLKGKLRRRGKPLKYNDKLEKINLGLTPTAKQRLTDMAKKQGISRSEVLERWLALDPSQLQKDYALCQEQLKQAQATIAQLTEKILKLL